MKTSATLAIAILLAGCAGPSPAPVPGPTAPAPVRTSSPERTPDPKRGEVTSIAIDQIFSLRQEDRVLLIDVRRPFFHQLGHIDGAISLPLVDFENAYPEVKPRLDAAAGAGKVIVVYCQSERCPDSTTTAEALADRGYDVSVYRGGWDEWRSVGIE